MTRVEDKGKEWHLYGLTLSAKDWTGNKIDSWLGKVGMISNVWMACL